VNHLKNIGILVAALATELTIWAVSVWTTLLILMNLIAPVLRQHFIHLENVPVTAEFIIILIGLSAGLTLGLYLLYKFIATGLTALVRLFWRYDHAAGELIEQYLKN
jgi:hypothetical protein